MEQLSAYVCILASFIRLAQRSFRAPYYIVVCGVSGSTILFLHYFTNGTIFGSGGGPGADRGRTEADRGGPGAGGSY
jgi:hypothetical protein